MSSFQDGISPIGGNASSLVYSFLTAFKRGVARPNRYEANFILPNGIKNLAQNTIGVNNDALNGQIARLQNYFNQGTGDGLNAVPGDIDIKCMHAVFPQRSLLTYEHRQNSAPFRLPYSSTYDPVTFSFYADSDLDTRDFFDVWQSAVVNITTNTMNFYDEYVSDVRLRQMDIEGNYTYGVTLYEAWPLDIGTIEVSAGSQDSISITTVTMAYKYWEPDYYNDSADGSGNNSVQRTAQ